MKRKTNKIFVLLAIIMLITMCFAFGASAETWRDYEYTVLEDGTVEITKYNGDETDIVIPSEIDGKMVTSIGNNAFYYCTDIRSIAFADGLKSIGDFAFSYCVSLTEVNLPDSVIYIGENAFRETFIEEINIPKNVINLNHSVFYGCIALQKVKFHSNLQTIDSFAFFGCMSLKEIEIPKSVIEIGEKSFDLCCSLSSVKIFNNDIILSDSSLGLTSLSIENIDMKDYVVKYRELWDLLLDDNENYIYAYETLMSYNVMHDPQKVTGTIYLHDDSETYTAETYAKENNIPVVRYHDFEDSEWVHDWENLVRTRKCSFEGCDAIESEPLNEADKPFEPTPEEKCDCICHSDGTFIRSLIAWVYKFVMGVLGINRTCVCGVTHY